MSYIDHETSITNTELDNMFKAKSIVQALEKLDVYCIRPSRDRVTVWLVKGIDRNTSEYRDIVVSTVTAETRPATKDELVHGVNNI